MLARKADRKTNRELTLLYHRLAKAADKLGENDKALKYYKQSYDLDSTYLPTLIDRAALLYKLEHWDDAFRIYQTILVHHRDTQKDDEIVDIFFRLGRIKLKLGERTKAVNMFEKALEIQPGHRADAAGAHRPLHRRRRLGGGHQAEAGAAGVAATTDLDEKFAPVRGDRRQIYKDKLNNPQKAIAAHLEALNFKPTDRQLLHNLLDLFSETKQWKKAMEILMKLAELETGKVKARYLVAAGNIANYELHSTDEAVELYNQALDEDPDDLKAFERIDKIMTAKKDWKNQERNYRKMIKRIGQEPPPEKKPTQVALWHALGEIYRSRLKDFKSATAAFEVCVQLDPDAAARHQILAELYQLSGPESTTRRSRSTATSSRRRRTSGRWRSHMKTLRRLFMEMRQYDRAWCVASALVFLRKADPEEQQFFEQYRAQGLRRAPRAAHRGAVAEQHLPPRRGPLHLGRLRGRQPGGRRRARQGAQGLGPQAQGQARRRHRPAAVQQGLQLRQPGAGRAAARAVPAPRVAGRAGSGQRAREGAADPVVRRRARACCRGGPEKELAYVIGKKLALMRPDHFVRWPNVVPTVAELKVVFLAALRLVQPKFEVKADLQQPVAQYLDLLRS